MPSAFDYYMSMTTHDIEQFGFAVSVTLLIGFIVLWLLFRLLSAKFQKLGLNPPTEAEAKQLRQSRAVAAAASAAMFVSNQRTSAPEKQLAAPASSHVAPDTAQIQDDASPSASSSAAASRHIPRAGQSALIQRGCRLLEEKRFADALPCFLAILAASIEHSTSSHEAPLPAQLTECLRGVGQCYMGLGKPEVAVQFLHAERRVFEEMVVQAASPEGRSRGATAPSIIASLLGGKSGSSPAELPRRCFTLSEVADACAKLGHPDVALAYRVKAAALKQKVSGIPLTPESEDAALLAHTLHEFEASKKHEREGQTS